MMQQQQQQQSEYHQADGNGVVDGGGGGQPDDFWTAAHDQQVVDFANAADETLSAANALQNMQETGGGLGAPDGGCGVQVTQQYAISFHQAGNTGTPWADEQYDPSEWLLRGENEGKKSRTNTKKQWQRVRKKKTCCPCGPGAQVFRDFYARKFSTSVFDRFTRENLMTTQSNKINTK